MRQQFYIKNTYKKNKSYNKSRTVTCKTYETQVSHNSRTQFKSNFILVKY
jgi:hypothetical protein